MEISETTPYPEPPLGSVSWLRSVAPGGGQWTAEAIDAVTVFALLCNLFEGSRFGASGKKPAVEELREIANTAGAGADAPTLEALDYWAKRYAGKDIRAALEFNAKLELAELPNVEEALSPNSKNMAPHDRRRAALMIAWRMRNNLFHGLKRLDRLNDQVENLRHASKLLSVYIGY